MTQENSKIFSKSNHYCGSKIIGNWELEDVQTLAWNKFSLGKPEFPCWKATGLVEVKLFVLPI